MTMQETLDTKAIDTLRSELKGTLLQPGDEQYSKSSQAWNLDARQSPALVIMAADAGDIIAAVKFAAEVNLGIAVMATGHGVGTRCEGGLLINTSRMRGVKIDPVAQTAKVGAGALWKDLIPEAYAHGLTGLMGSAPHVGIVGYTLGGGFGYLGRKYGLNAEGVIAAEIVTADGKLVRISADENAELFWGLKGSGWNFGVITSLEFRLYPLTTIYGGAVFYPIETAREALNLYTRWSDNIPDEITAAFVFMNIPPLPSMPEALRGKSVVIMRGCYCGENSDYGEELFKPLRKQLGEPIMDTFRVMEVNEMGAICNDPVDPFPVLQYSGMLTDLSDDAIDTFVKIAGAGSGSPVTIVEFRQLGGALQRDQQNMSLMGKGTAKYSLNALGAALTPDMAKSVSAYFKFIAEKTQHYQTGEIFINFLEIDPAADRVRSAYNPQDWKRLTTLKNQYDSKNIFRFNRNIPPQIS